MKRFPSTGEDGLFIIEARFILSSGHSLSVERLVAWIQDWKQNSLVWERTWSSGRIEIMKFDEAFVREPEVVEISGSNLSIFFHGRSDSSNWKEWFAKFVNDLIDKQFGVIRLESCRDINGGN